MKAVERAAIALLVALLGVGCNGNDGPLSAGDASERSGLEGRVVRGPMCPVESIADPCPDEGFAASFRVFNDAGAGVAVFVSDAEGRFRVGLAPGAYRIVPGEDAPLLQPSTQHATADVAEGEYATVTLRFDTGIR